MSKHSQRGESMYRLGLKDSKTKLEPRWIRHPLKKCYMAGWYEGRGERHGHQGRWYR